MIVYCLEQDLKNIGRRSEYYLTQNPGVSPDTIHWIRKNHQNIRCIGIDCISMARYDDAEIAKKTHITAFKIDESYGEPLLFIEDMKLEKIGRPESLDNDHCTMADKRN